ncbi:MAG: TetR family transcriptional regulator [Candidatus Limnocylindria bacterium]
MRITEAAVRLHTTVGPSEASFAAVADAAGVTRLTLYRHFATREELFAACMSHWRAAHPPPHAEAWRTVRRFDARLRRAVDELYAWYAENADDLYPIYRDAAFTPASTHKARRQSIERFADAILADRAAPASHALRASIGHVLGFWTWRSLVIEEDCSQSEAVDLAVRFVAAAARRR